MPSYKITVQGKVQGVYYRKTIHAKAQDMGLKGYVKNLKSGDVEVGVSLDENQYNLFVDVLKKGSPSSKVTHLKIRRSNEEFEEFSIRY